MVGWGILFIAIFLAIFGAMVQMWKGLPKWIVAVCATIVSLSGSVAGSYLYENLKPFLPPISNTTSSDGMTKQDMGESNDIMQNEELPGQNNELPDGNSDFDNTNFEETMPDTAENESTESEDRQESPSYDTEPETTYSNETVLNTSVEATKENISPLYNIEDITGVSTVTGKIKNEGQKNRYKFTSGVNGVYRFDSDLSAGGSVKIRISGENDETIDSGTNNLTIYLEKNKTYIMSAEYRNGPCDYIIKIGVPNELADVTGSTSVSGSITYQDQNDQYRYVAPVSGRYRFDSDLSAGGSVKIRISGENGNSLSSNTNALTIDLEAGKTYILNIGYRNGSCDYTINIGVPVAIADISGANVVVGSIRYQDQGDRYRYTAPISGIYRFDTDLSAGGSVKIRISGENGNSLSSSTNALTINLEAGKTYILSVEYRDVPCDYTVNIGVPIAVTDITEEGYISGCIRYRDQTDRYLYTAPDTGTYRFSTDLDAGGKVKVRIGGENGNSIKYAINDLSVNLEEGKTYMLSVEYENGPCFYEVFIEEDYD